MPMFILVLLIAALVTVFSVQNAAPVTISFLTWTFESSLAIVILLSTVMGVLLASAVFMLMSLRRAIRKKAADKEKHEAGDQKTQGAGGP